ncbi:ricin-type beta-trefoil lectin protein [Nonomuraea fuscirosea]|uniref:Ricin-type beta-trefoil lectin protein n=1 Tax=Nonomuraea fuscirosea TaxID=1291556 RepID=A0A2T0LT54_9ACTN|nr:RICIN domain-containing protein [Nonomuraea fuscirosea]PRX46803.1 ricin-type beta-trefoil lectin protein [Nonomuraea fuscirosea]
MNAMNRGLLLLVTAITLVTPLAASPAAAEPSIYHKLVPQHSSDKCLDVQDASRAHGAHVLQATCWNPGYNQQWTIVGNINDYFKLVPKHSSDKCLDVQDASRAHGAYVLQATCWNPGYNQQWKLRQVPGPKWPGTGYPFQLVARHSGLCLDVQDASRAHGAHVLQATCSDPANPRANQIWRMRTP